MEKHKKGYHVIGEIYNRANISPKDVYKRQLDLFAEMMIEKIESIRKDWRKPWFTEGALQWPRHLSGREYNLSLIHI